MTIHDVFDTCAIVVAVSSILVAGLEAAYDPAEVKPRLVRFAVAVLNALALNLDRFITRKRA